MNSQKLAHIDIVDYQAEYGLETVKMWRRSFQRAMSLAEVDPIEAVTEQLNFFRTIDPSTIKLGIDTQSSAVVGLWVQNKAAIEHLYVHVAYQGVGLGSRFMALAKQASPEVLSLFTFQRNTRAQAFYKHHGFREVRRGFAELSDNPWASSEEELADIEYLWHPST